MRDMYKEAGVDVNKGYEAVERMKKHIEKTDRKEVLGGIGAFGGLFDLSGFEYDEPVLVSGTDGVGTKLKLAVELQKHDTIGRDLVAMCVNDIAAQGASPLFFLDYIGCGKNDPLMVEEIVSGIASGCRDAGAALIGGETAEMPDMYAEEEYDLAGFVVGMAEKARLITGDAIRSGDVIIGLPSSGIHSNGFSLVRKTIRNLDLQKTYDGMERTLAEDLLTPTRIYAPLVGKLMEHVTIKGISHITGGGFYENFPRMLPDGLGVSLDESAWEVPAIFSFLQKQGGIPLESMYHVFNMGIGMALVVHPDAAGEATRQLENMGEKAAVIGRVCSEEGVHFK